jgi:glutamate mutase epsilon subunit
MLPEWVKVKVAAVAGLTGTTLPTFIDHVSPILDVLIKAGQIGVAAVTIGYIYTKWRNARRKK